MQGANRLEMAPWISLPSLQWRGGGANPSPPQVGLLWLRLVRTNVIKADRASDRRTCEILGTWATCHSRGGRSQSRSRSGDADGVREAVPARGRVDGRWEVTPRDAADSCTLARVQGRDRT